MMIEGIEMMGLISRLFPICRSITGNGVRQTLAILKEYVQELEIKEIPSGSKVFDWTIPKEWNISDAYIETLHGERVIDFKENNLHVLGYSTAVDKIVSLDELLTLVYTQPDQPDAIPYVTSYYQERFGFCMSENQKRKLKDTYYHIVIRSSMENGFLTYGELILKGKSDEEVFFSTYVCHPSMANNELSGPSVVIELVKFIKRLPNRRYSYRIIFIPETIGAIAYLSRNHEVMKKNVVAGFNVSCVGDNRVYSYVSSPYGDTLADKIATNVLKYHFPDYKTYSFLKRGSDERQYCSPGISLPVCAICRSKYGEYPEYHTSLDNLDLVSVEGLQGAYEVYKKCIIALENNYKYQVTCFCEPQLGKRGLYPTISKKGSYNEVETMVDFLAYADGQNDLIDISNRINKPVDEILRAIYPLLREGLLLVK